MGVGLGGGRWGQGRCEQRIEVFEKNIKKKLFRGRVVGGGGGGGVGSEGGSG